MLNRAAFAGETYRQTDNYCVLASYAVAMKPFLVRKVAFLAGKAVDVSNFFEGYCAEMALCTSKGIRTALAEKFYLGDFVIKTNVGKVSGYHLIEEIHNHSTTAPFDTARKKVSLFHTGLPHDLNNVEASLKDEKPTVAIVFVNSGITLATHNIQQHHSVVLGYDNAGFYIYDVNRGAGVVDIGPSAGVLSSADCLVFTKK